MFVLRQFANGGVESNRILGDHYQVIYREQQYDLFQQTFKDHFEQDHVADLDPSSTEATKKCFGFIIFQDGSRLWPLYCHEHYYVMTGKGSTFSCLTMKG